MLTHHADPAGSARIERKQFFQVELCSHGRLGRKGATWVVKIVGLEDHRTGRMGAGATHRYVPDPGHQNGEMGC